jgi:thiol-disulfide isomerase/thioredoxin
MLRKACRAYFCFVLLHACANAAPPASARSDLLGKSVEMSLPTEAGQLSAVPAAGAKATVADFFAPTCAPCRKKVPALYQRRAELHAAGAQLVLIGLLDGNESTEDARSALASWGIPGASFLVDSGDASRREAGVQTLPTTLVLDARGVVRWVSSAESSASEVVAAARAVTH